MLFNNRFNFGKNFFKLMEHKITLKLNRIERGFNGTMVFHVHFYGKIRFTVQLTQCLHIIQYRYLNISNCLVDVNVQTI